MITLGVPLNSLTWVIGSISMVLFGLKNINRYKITKNYLNYNLAWFGMTLAVGLALTSFAELFTTKIAILHAFNLLSEIFISLAFIVKSRLLWYMVFKGKVPYLAILLPVVAIAIWGWVANLNGSTTSIREPFVDFRYANEGVIAQNIFLGGIIIPIGLTFLVKGFQELLKTHRLRPFFKPFLMGITYIGIALSTIDRNLQGDGAETPQSALTNMFLFIVLIIVLILPPLRKR